MAIWQHDPSSWHQSHRELVWWKTAQCEIQPWDTSTSISNAKGWKMHTMEHKSKQMQNVYVSNTKRFQSKLCFLGLEVHLMVTDKLIKSIK